jgi:signal transduction histidine kinase
VKSPDVERVLVLVKGGRDGELTRALLERDGLHPTVCADVEALCAELAKGASALLIAEEALTRTAVGALQAALVDQPVWSDLPIVVFSSAEQPRARLMIETIHQLGNVTFLDRPVQVRSMLASVHAAVRSRRRQYETRDAIESRDSFLAMLGHELRNPLAAIRLASTILHGRDIESDAMKEVDIIERQSRHLTRIVDDLLDVARITHGKVALRLERLLLANAVESAFEVMERGARGHLERFELVIEDRTLIVDGDRQRLEQVFTNLFTNAIKYTPKGGTVIVAVRAEEDRAVVAVTDTGIGLAPEMKDHVFDVFVQAERSLDRAQGGIGVGLALVRGIVELHGGTVRAESGGLGKGSSFVISVPLAPAGPEVEVPKSAPGLAAPRKRVVIVEDNLDVRELLAELLEGFGHEVTCAAAGAEGVQTILGVSPDIAFVDIGLPGIDGLEVARRVRAAHSSVRLVAMTGYGQQEDKALAKQAGFDDHLTKPVERSAITRALQQSDAK